MSAEPPLAVEVTGSGDAIVMIHGLGGTSTTFQPLMGTLSGFRVCRPDMPGSGRSPLPAGRVSIETHATAVLTWMATAGVSRAHFVGHSMGTLVCQHLAQTQPETVASLTLFGALRTPPDAARQGLVKRAATARTDGMAAIADQISSATLAPQSIENSPAAVAFVRESILRQPPEGYARNCEALAAATPADLGAITAPTLLITGDTDPVAPVSMARQLADGIAGATLKILDRCGHWSLVEQPQISARHIGAFLAHQQI